MIRGYSKTSKKLLPSGWRLVELGNVCKFTNGNAYRESDWSNSGIPIIRIQNLNDPSKAFNYWAGSLEARVCVKNGDLLLAWSGTPGTSFGAHIWNRGLGVLNQHIFLVNFISDVLDAQWAKHAINHALDDLIRAAHGAVGLAHVTRKEVDSLLIPLPPLSEQRRIVRVLREKMAAVEKARTAAQSRLETVNCLPASCLRQVFPQANQTLPDGWRLVTIDNVCEVRLGKMLSPASKIGYRTVPYLRNANVQWNRFDLTEVTEMDFTEEQEAVLSLRVGDLLVCEGGEPGRAAVWEGQISRCCYQKALHRIRPIDHAVDPHFVMYRLWQGAFNKEFIASNAKTTIAHLPAIRLKNLKIAIPRIEEQKRIAKLLGEKMAAAEKARVAIEEELATINAIPASLLRQACNGEI